ncbi:hypothetical protein PR003_g32227 [Phytophthora rubi]|uniref:Uncharacterized protein n=1 Tax=Phytophthora rubi TaxID=129364 RepID=A0A6A4B6G4_9STRA|nr:hypothetical protein PR002_g30974 [Phytophthora rubi]KAE9266139.1 hypothetical protein PR003_g32227 [Phytophthora rubi]
MRKLLVRVTAAVPVLASDASQPFAASKRAPDPYIRQL